MRTYAGHTSAAASNELFRTNLAKGQTGLSVAFDLPTQTGYDSDHPLARGEVGKVGVPVRHIADMERLFAEIPLERMNTSMTINATAPWLLALYVALARKRGLRERELAGTTQNDILKEYLSRGTYIFPPGPSMRLCTDLITYTVREMPRWNPINVCSYHLQEAGAKPVEELAICLANAVAVLDAVEKSGRLSAAEMQEVFGRISFFVNAGMRLVEEVCKLKAFVHLWDEIGRERYGVKDPKLRRFRYGIQVNSLNLTEQQPENNIARIVIEALAAVISRDARARAIQLPAWNEALGLPRPWDQQWSLRVQQILAYETDLLEHEDIFAGSKVLERRVREMVEDARALMAKIEAQGGAVAAIESGFVKAMLVASNAARLREIEEGRRIVVGVNRFTESEPSPLAQSGAAAFLEVDPAAEEAEIAELRAFRAQRSAGAVKEALARLRAAAQSGENIVPPSIAAAEVGVTTGEWADALRAVFGEYRAPTGISGSLPARRAGSGAARLVGRLTERLGGPPRLLVGKPGLDGHSNGAEQIALAARDAGMEVVYMGIRTTAAEIARAAVEEGVHLVGLSVLSGSHRELALAVIRELERAGVGNLPVVVGGIVPPGDREWLRERGVRAVYTPKDFSLEAIVCDLCRIIDATTS